MASSDALVCVDASFYVQIMMPDEESAEADAVWQHWLYRGTDIHAPSLFRWECLNALRRAILRDRLLPARAIEARAALLAVPVIFVPMEDEAARVWDFVIEYDLPTVYDALYLAVADDLSCELWTEDHRLYRAVRDRLPWVRCSSLEA